MTYPIGPSLTQPYLPLALALPGGYKCKDLEPAPPKNKEEILIQGEVASEKN